MIVRKVKYDSAAVCGKFGYFDAVLFNARLWQKGRQFLLRSIFPPPHYSINKKPHICNPLKVDIM